MKNFFAIIIVTSIQEFIVSIIFFVIVLSPKYAISVVIGKLF